MMALHEAQAGVRSNGASCLLPAMGVSYPILNSSEIMFDLRSSPHLSSLALEAPDALLPPLGSHRERLGLLVGLACCLHQVTSVAADQVTAPTREDLSIEKINWSNTQAHDRNHLGLSGI